MSKQFLIIRLYKANKNFDKFQQSIQNQMKFPNFAVGKRENKYILG